MVLNCIFIIVAILTSYAGWSKVFWKGGLTEKAKFTEDTTVHHGARMS